MAAFKLAFICLVFVLSVKCNKSAGDVKYEEGNNAGSGTDENVNSILTEMNQFVDDTSDGEGSGNDDEDNNDDISGSGVSESSGTGDTWEGSGNEYTDSPETTEKTKETTPEIIDINDGSTTTTTKAPVTTTTTKKPTEKTTTMSNEVEININIEEEDNKREKDPNVDDNTVHGGKDKQTMKNTGNKDKEGISFTLGIIIGVVVGSILAILIIVFLVYRLRKKDEGSYSLDDQSSTQFIRDNDSPVKGGKEYFA